MMSSAAAGRDRDRSHAHLGSMARDRSASRVRARNEQRPLYDAVPLAPAFGANIHEHRPTETAAAACRLVRPQRPLLVPFLMPGIIMGIALVTVFLNLKVQLSLKTVIVGHITMLVPICTILTAASLARWDRTIEAAAMDLGASELRTFWHVTLPHLRSTLAGVILLSLTFSLDEITRTFFLTGTDNTLPLFT